MKLRVYFVRHRLKQSRYEKSREHRDFEPEVVPQKAYQSILEEFGSILDGKKEVELLIGKRIKVAPDQYVTIKSHTMVDEGRESVVLPSERHTEQQLFSPMEMRVCLQDSPALKSKRFRHDCSRT